MRKKSLELYILEGHPYLLGKKKGSQHYQEQFCIQQSFTHPPQHHSLGLISPRTKGGSCPLHPSPCTCRGTINHHHHQDAKRASGHSGGLHLVPWERWGRSFWGAQGSDAIPSQPAAQGEAMPSLSYMFS